ncbi:MAG: endo alpha-1,4 polygalactosaminidase [Acidimicrobiales bacterium]|nr:endo alpha-1,4 polygalactosaminidase [Acidimicrobiales bacterium]
MNRPTSKRRRALLLAVSVGTTAAIGATVGTPTGVGAAVPYAPRPAWNQVSSWGINNAAFDANGIAQIRGSVRDMVIIGRHNSYNGREWTRDEIEAGKLSKWLLAYMTVGEAQKSEWYWNPAYNANPPSWAIGTNPYWSNNVYAELWNGDWQAILHQHIDRVIDQGFDGAFLDVADSYWYPGYPGGPEWYNKWEAALTVCALAQHARSRNPEFKIVVNNALDLFWMVPNYMDCIDGTVIEGLWWKDGTTPRDAFYHNQKIGELAYHQAAGKPIFALDYAPWWDAGRVDAEARSRGYLPYVVPYGQENPLPS